METMVLCFFYNNTLNSEVPLSTHKRKLNSPLNFSAVAHCKELAGSEISFVKKKEKTVGEIAKKTPETSLMF